MTSGLLPPNASSPRDRARRDPGPCVRRAAGALAGLLLLSTAAASAELQDLRKRALELVNDSRASNNLPPLGLAEPTSQAASAHAKDMLQREYYAHTSPEGRTVKDRYEAASGSAWRVTAENIARCAGCNPPATVESVDRLHEGWMNSPEHRANILRRGLETFGFGLEVDEQRGLYAVQTFAGPGVPRGLAEGEQPAPVSAHELDDHAVAQLNPERRVAGVEPVEASNALSEAARSALANATLSDEDVLQVRDVFDRLPSSERRNWRSLLTLMATCGGCGTYPTTADIRYFVRQWLENSDYRQRLVDRNVTSLGFAVHSNGEGKKAALAILGIPR